jgi:hypothetical protein
MTAFHPTLYVNSSAHDRRKCANFCREHVQQRVGFTYLTRLPPSLEDYIATRQRLITIAFTEAQAFRISQVTNPTTFGNRSLRADGISMSSSI